MTTSSLPRHQFEPSAALSAAVYCRISLARFGDTVKVDDQERIARQLAAQRGWRVADRHVFKDNSASAWKRNRRRPGWDALISAVERGEIQGIVVYHGDRLIRQPWDLELLLQLADKRGIRLASVMGDRNLDNPDDRYILRIEAASACRESDNTSRRLKSHHERQAERGLHRPGGRGGRAFGFETDGITHRDEEAAVVRECVNRVLAGESVGAICRDLNSRGIRTTPGNAWDHGALKKLLCRPRLAGLLVHNGAVVGPAAWQPVVDREKWEAARFVLERKANAFDYATNARRYLLTGIALCGTCDSPLTIRHNTRSESLRGYGCINSDCTRKVHRSVHHLNDFVGAAAVTRLSDPELKKRLAVPMDHGLIEQLSALEANRQELFTTLAHDPSLGADFLRMTVPALDARIAEMRSQIGEASVGSVLEGLLGITRDDWDNSLGLDRQRAAVRRLFRITVLPSRRGPGFEKADVRLDPLV